MKSLTAPVVLLLASWAATPALAQCQVPSNGDSFAQGTIYYSISPNLPIGVQMAIQQAIQDWDSKLPDHTFSTGPFPMIEFKIGSTGQACGQHISSSNSATGEIFHSDVLFPSTSSSYNYQQSLKTAAHEIGHLFGLGHPSNCTESQTIMQPTPNGQCLRTTFPPGFINLPTQQDANMAAARSYTVTSNAEWHNDEEYACAIDYGNWDPYSCTCDYDNRGGLPGPGSPIIVSIGESRFDLTDAAGGVPFDIDGDGVMDQMAWTPTNAQDAFLVLDRNFNGLIDNGLELFGNFTVQPHSDERNGYLALAMLESPELGGRTDGRITPEDSVFEQLKLWFDLNHDGVADATELSSLSSKGIVAIDLDYKASRRRDRHGNEFRYSSAVHFADGRTSKTVDVFLVRQ